MSDSQERVRKIVEGSPVVLFMKGNKFFPQCGFSARAVDILTREGAKFETVDILADPEIRQGAKDFANWPTFPQLYIRGEFIGGSDIMAELHAAGQLKEKLASAAG